MVRVDKGTRPGRNYEEVSGFQKGVCWSLRDKGVGRRIGIGASGC